MSHEGAPDVLLREGLEGVAFTRTRLSAVDGRAGRLTIGGRSLDALQCATPEQVAELLWDCAPVDLGAARERAWEVLHRPSLEVADGMDALRGAVANHWPVTGDIDGATQLVASVGVFVASWIRVQLGQEPQAPDAGLPHADDLLRMSVGGPPSHAQALRTYLTTVSDHGMNASTFACRVVASTESDMVSSVTAAIGALKGPLHGGAPGPVLDMLDAAADDPRGWVQAALERDERIMGFGHRVYKTRDPRADALARAVRSLESNKRLTVATTLEQAALELLAQHKPGRSLFTNVEFYTALLLDALGFPRAAFTPLFACGRVIGWTAHYLEQRAAGRLIRPTALYAR